MSNEPKDLRSVKMIRIGKVSEPVEDRMYQTELKGSKTYPIDFIAQAYKGRFDLVVLHDLIDECMLLNVNTGEYGVLPCQIHHRLKK